MYITPNGGYTAEMFTRNNSRTTRAADSFAAYVSQHSRNQAPAGSAEVDASVTNRSRGGDSVSISKDARAAFADYCEEMGRKHGGFIRHRYNETVSDTTAVTPPSVDETENVQAKPGANSLAIMHSINGRSDCLNLNFVQTTFLVTLEKIYFSWSLTINRLDGGTEIISEEPWIRVRSEAEIIETAKSSQRNTNSYIMDRLMKALSENGIRLAPGEDINISVDRYLNVTVTGKDSEKAKAIENVFNTPGEYNYGLLLKRVSIENSNLQANGGKSNINQEQRTQINKMLLENYFINAGGGVSLNDLYLSDDGKIMGLPPELDEFINSIEPRYRLASLEDMREAAGMKYDSLKSTGISKHASFGAAFNTPEVQDAFDAGNKEEYIRLATENLIEDAGGFADLKTVLTQILKTGVDNIPDIGTSNITMGDGIFLFV